MARPPARAWPRLAPARADPALPPDRRLGQHDRPAPHEAQTAAREFLAKCDFTTMEVGLISFSTLVALQAQATSNVRRLHAAVHRLEAEGSTNLTDALEMAQGSSSPRPEALHRDPDRWLSRCPESAVERRWPRASRHRDRGDRHRRRRPRLSPAAGQQRAGLDLRQERRAGADVRPYRAGDRRRRARPCASCHEPSHAARATPAPPPATRIVASCPGSDFGATCARPTTWRSGRRVRRALRPLPLRRAGSGRSRFTCATPWRGS